MVQQKVSDKQTATAGRESDSRLIQRCLKGDEEAWFALIERYQSYTYAIILRYGVGRDGAADVFQEVWLDVLNDLPKLRKHATIRRWLAAIALRRSYHHQRQLTRAHLPLIESDDVAESELIEAPEWLEELERQQQLRESIRKLSGQCQELVRMLFYEEEPRPYSEVARSLGLAEGSIGSLRASCLKKLQRIVVREGGK